MDTRDLYKLVRELSEDRYDEINLYDSMDIELSESFVIETGVVGFTEDGVIVHLDEDAMEFLDFNGVLLESEEQINEDQDSVDAVCNSILNRIARQHSDVLQKFGPQAVMYAAEDVAEFAASGGLDEIGSSDVSIWTKQVIQDLEAGQYAHLNENPALMALGRAAAMGAGSELAGRVADKIGLEEGGSSDVDAFKAKISTSNDPFELVYDAISGKHGEPIRTAMQDMYDDIVIDFRLHPDDDFEKIIDKMLDYLDADSGMNEQIDELADIKRLAGQEEVDEGLGKALLGGAALIAAITGLSKMEAHRMMTTEPQLITLAQMRQEAEQKGDEYKVKELDDRIEKTMSHIGITGRPVMGGDGEPIDPRKPWAGESIQEAEYQGRKVQLGKPMQGDVAKSKVYVKKPNGKVVKVNFGDKNMTIKKNNPARRKSFRARHNCENPGPRWKARYWSCRAW
jgi:hypothetical protein